MRIIIAGSRTCTDMEVLNKAIIVSGVIPTVVLSGKARGADTLGEQWATINGISVEPYPADWEQFGKAAGSIRNQQMADNAEGLIALWDGKSKGTKDMIQRARRNKLWVHVQYF